LRPKNTDFQILKLSPNYQSERGIGTIVSFQIKMLGFPLHIPRR